jgi:hypothetical protein
MRGGIMRVRWRALVAVVIAAVAMVAVTPTFAAAGDVVPTAATVSTGR